MHQRAAKPLTLEAPDVDHSQRHTLSCKAFHESQLKGRGESQGLKKKSMACHSDNSSRIFRTAITGTETTTSTTTTIISPTGRRLISAHNHNFDTGSDDDGHTNQIIHSIVYGLDDSMFVSKEVALKVRDASIG